LRFADLLWQNARTDQSLLNHQPLFRKMLTLNYLNMTFPPAIPAAVKDPMLPDANEENPAANSDYYLIRAKGENIAEAIIIIDQMIAETLE